MSPRVARALVFVLILSLFPIGARDAFAVAAPSVSVDPVQISPNGDGDRDATRITVRLSSTAKLQLRVLSSGGTVQGYIKHFGAAQSAGTYRYGFNGTVTNSSGSRVALSEGTYYVQASTMGTDGSIARRNAKTYINNTVKSVSVRSTILSYNGYPSRFSPNGDQRKDGVVSRFYIIRPANVRMQIYAGSSLLRTISSSFTTVGSKSMGWNGRYYRDGVWQWAPAGSYRIRIAATPQNSSMASAVGTAFADRVMASDKTRPGVSTSVSRSSFTPSAGESVRFSYSLRESGYRRITIVNSAGSVVNSTSWGSTGTTGSYTWLGRNSSGSRVAAGTYTLRLYAQDRAGNAATYYPSSRSVKVLAGTTSTANSGSASKTPWSGYWWPQLSTYSTKLYNNPGPMTKYDRVTGAGAYSWEYNNHRTTNTANDWWGHCQAWSAAAIMERQPYARTVGGVYFSQDDVEGLFSETWTVHTGTMWGTRYRDEGTGSGAYKDVYPADFDRLVRYWIGSQRTALIMDYTTGTAVWNYPVYAFSRSATTSGDKQYVKMTLTRAAPNYGVNGTSPVRQTFYYTLQSGTNGWWYNPSGTSVNSHPDYIVKVSGRADAYGNPRVTPTKLNEMFR